MSAFTACSKNTDDRDSSQQATNDQDQALNLVTSQSLRRPLEKASVSPIVVEACDEPDSSSASSSKKRKHQIVGVVKGNSVKLTIGGKSLIFPFRPTDNVGILTSDIKETIGQDCQVLDTDGARYTSRVTLADVRIPFDILAGDNRTTITGNDKDVRTVGHASFSSSSASEGVTEEAVLPDGDTAAQFGRVATAAQAVQLLTFVHEKVACGKSINSALKMAKKDRKTIDRFQHIYYLHYLNKDKLKQIEEQWKGNVKSGGLQALDTLASKELNWHKLNKLADDAVLTLFSGRKGNA